MFLLVALWALAEATVFFIVADVPIMALAAKRGVHAGIMAAWIGALSAALGGLVVWLWGGFDPRGFDAFAIALPGIDAELVAQTRADWAENGFLAMLTGSFGGTPYKLYAAAAGYAGSYGLIGFILLSVVARLPRFMLVAVAGGWLGPRLRARLGERNFWIAFVAAWVLFYAAYFTAMGW
ncbi:hypothetical protein OZN62_08160 [Aurantiacibacter sp. MUD11]|uniref:hypothetical protein n=1 Tax=Aurantiacibacter sp. MUD11 TaxID=3003265 RepID=UPI0022AAFC2D|nr:hypothetical protein [Aurantiacibacter sp. MUD11]WAT16913.1 hypothetical protein OZN62_08160 [Aurantiacibacter sp. MUD11]